MPLSGTVRMLYVSYIVLGSACIGFALKALRDLNGSACLDSTIGCC